MIDVTNVEIYGNKFIGQRFIGDAHRLIAILRSNMSRNDLTIGRQQQLVGNPGGYALIVATSVHGQHTAVIYTELPSKKVTEKLQERIDSLAVFLICSNVTDTLTWVSFSLEAEVLSGKLAEVTANGYKALLYGPVLIWQYDKTRDSHAHINALLAASTPPPVHDIGVGYIVPFEQRDFSVQADLPNINIVIFDDSFISFSKTLYVGESGSTTTTYKTSLGTQCYQSKDYTKFTFVEGHYGSYIYISATAVKFIAVDVSTDDEFIVEYRVLDEGRKTKTIPFSEIITDHCNSNSSTEIDTEGTLPHQLAAITVKRNCLLEVSEHNNYDQIKYQFWVSETVGDTDLNTAIPIEFKVNLDIDGLPSDVEIINKNNNDCLIAKITIWEGRATTFSKDSLWGKLSNILPTFANECSIDNYRMYWYLTVFPFIMGGYYFRNTQTKNEVVSVKRLGTVLTNWPRHMACVSTANNPVPVEDEPVIQDDYDQPLTSVADAYGTQELSFVSDIKHSVVVDYPSNHSVLSNKGILFYSSFVLERVDDALCHWNDITWDAISDTVITKDNCCSHWTSGICTTVSVNGIDVWNSHPADHASLVTGIEKPDTLIGDSPLPSEYLLPSPGANIADYLYYLSTYEDYIAAGYTREEALVLANNKTYTYDYITPLSSLDLDDRIVTTNKYEEKRGRIYGIGETSYPSFGGKPTDYSRNEFNIHSTTTNISDLDGTSFVAVVEAEDNTLYRYMRFVMEYSSNNYTDTMKWFLDRHLFQQFTSVAPNGAKHYLLFFKSVKCPTETNISVTDTEGLEVEQAYLYCDGINYYDLALNAMKTMYQDDITGSTEDNDILTYMYMV